MPNPFVFLLGCPRSGTTLLRRMVDAHPQIAIVPEIRWLASTFAHREQLTREGMVTPAFLNQLKNLGRFSHLPISAQELASFHERSISYADFMSLLFDRYGENKGQALVGQKNADHAVAMDIQTLHTLWPEAKFVHLIRDGRDVCLSVLNWRIKEKVARLFSNWNSSPVANVALWWEWQIRSGREGGRTLDPQQYRELRYEFMVAHPDEACAQLCDFMDIPYDDRMVRFYEGSNPGQKAKQAWVPATTGRRDWQSQMSPEDLEQFEAVAGDLLDELGYPRGTDRYRSEFVERAAMLRSAFELRPLPQHWIAGKDVVQEAYL